ncbi:hypothetical protein ACQJBY_051915 [Aegilops geniculata]
MLARPQRRHPKGNGTRIKQPGRQQNNKKRILSPGRTGGGGRERGPRSPPRRLLRVSDRSPGSPARNGARELERGGGYGCPRTRGSDNVHQQLWLLRQPDDRKHVLEVLPRHRQGQEDGPSSREQNCRCCCIVSHTNGGRDQGRSVCLSQRRKTSSRGGGAEATQQPLPVVPEEGRADGVQVPLRRHLLLDAPLR